MLRCAVLASGRGSNLEALLQAKERGELPVEFVLVATDKPGAPAIARAKARGIPTWEASAGCDPQRFFAELAAELEGRAAELVILAGFMRILPESFLARFSQRVINIHPSLLPAFPGLHAQRQALAYGVRYSGCTVHFVDAGVDTGPVIDQAVVPVLPSDSEETLAERILAEEHRLLPACVRLIAEGRVSVQGRIVTIAPLRREAASDHQEETGK